MSEKKGTRTSRDDGENPRVALAGFRLLSCQARAGWQGADKSSIPQPQLRQDINVRIGVDESNPKGIVIFVGLSLGEQNNTETGFLVNAEYALYVVASNSQLSGEQRDSIGRQLGLQTSWPYWRELVQSMTGRLGLPAIRLPFINPASVDLEHNAVVEQRSQGQRRGRRVGRRASKKS